MSATCIIPNCRKRAPATEPFCAKHRGGLSRDEQRIVDWLQSEYETSETLPTDARYMISIIKRCILDGDHRK